MLAGPQSGNGDPAVEAAGLGQAVCVRFITDPPVNVTPYLLKGAMIRKFPNHTIIPFIDGHYREQFRYPRVQVKVLRNQLCIFGLGRGYEPVKSFQEQLDSLTVDDQIFKVMGSETPQDGAINDQPADHYRRYKFITPWVALNRRSLTHYKLLLPLERVNYLNRVLVQNLLFIARELGVTPDFTVSVRVKLQSLSPRVVEDQGSGSFKGYFTSNMQLPDYLGLGNGITKGLGTIVGMWS